MLFLMNVGQCLDYGKSHKSDASGSWVGNGLLNWALHKSDIRTLAHWIAHALCGGVAWLLLIFQDPSLSIVQVADNSDI